MGKRNNKNLLKNVLKKVGRENMKVFFSSSSKFGWENKYAMGDA